MRELTSKLPLPDVPHGTEGLIQTIWLLMTATVAVPLVCKLPGGSPVLGFLVSLIPLHPHHPCFSRQILSEARKHFEHRKILKDCT